MDFNTTTENLWDVMVERVGEQVEFDENAELVGFGLIEKPDYEVERWTLDTEVDECGEKPIWVCDDSSYIDQPSWTQSGDNPVINDQYSEIDRKATAGGWSYIKPDYRKEHYSSAKTKGKKQERNFHTILRFICLNQDKPATLRRGWAKMWERVYSEKGNFLFSSQVKCLKVEFAKRGIKSVSR